LTSSETPVTDDAGILVGILKVMYPLYTEEPGVRKIIYSLAWSDVPLCLRVFRAVREPLVLPFAVVSEAGRRLCPLASAVADAAGAVVDGIAVTVGIDVAVVEMVGLAVGVVVGGDTRVLVGADVYVDVTDGTLIAVGEDVLVTA
jgi:hypothetical protein